MGSFDNPTSGSTVCHTQYFLNLNEMFKHPSAMGVSVELTMVLEVYHYKA